MIRSLYTRVVLIFLVAVIGGTLLAFFVATSVFREQLNENLKLPLLYLGQDIAHIYEILPLQEADQFVSDMNQLKSYYVRIYRDPEQFQSYGGMDGYKPVAVTREQVEQVLKGETVQTNPSGVSTLLGIPFTTEDGAKAMFLESIGLPATSFLIIWVLNFSLYALGIGSALVLLAAMFIVKPIKRLTMATRHIAGGDFNVKLNIRQGGELGTLARSFEKMVHDLQQLEQMRREFVSNVSHEIQSPLTSISGYARALKQVHATEDQRSRYLDIIIAEADRMSNMSDSLLKLSLLESQTQQLELADFSLDEQIRRVIVALQPQWSVRGITFDLHLKPVRITADSDLLSQVWTNLIGNSIKFSPDGSVIGVKLKLDAQQAAVSITDNGIGISPEDQERIFERFYKADRSRSRKYSGSGMGLAIVKQIVALHHGDIRLDSGLGRGTSVTILLPVAAAKE